jgi:hypothetical protein
MEPIILSSKRTWEIAYVLLLAWRLFTLVPDRPTSGLLSGWWYLH